MQSRRGATSRNVRRVKELAIYMFALTERIGADDEGTAGAKFFKDSDAQT